MYSTAVFIICFSACLALVSAGVKFHDCGSKLANITNVEVSNCTAEPCELKRGTSVTVKMNFDANSEIDTAVTKVYGYIGGVKVPFPLSDKNACDFMKCPVPKGTSDQYERKLYVKMAYPALTVIIQWELRADTESGKMITCFTIPGKIV